MSTTSSRSTTRELTYCALFAVLIAVCAWISIPTSVPFTLQLLGIYLALILLGGRLGTQAVLVYILLGAVGIPVFAGFSGGLGILLGNTGGYILGFIFTGLIYWAITKCFGEKLPVTVIAMILGLIACYVFGTAWFMILYARNSGPIGLATALGWCVIPFIIPDLCKIALAIVIGRILKPHVK